MQENTKGLMTAFAIVACGGIALTDPQLTQSFALAALCLNATRHAMKLFGLDPLPRTDIK